MPRSSCVVQRCPEQRAHRRLLNLRRLRGLFILSCRLGVLAVKMSFESLLSLAHHVLLPRVELVRPVTLRNITRVTRVHEATCQLCRTEPMCTKSEVLSGSVRSGTVSSVAQCCFLVVTHVPRARALNSRRMPCPTQPCSSLASSTAIQPVSPCRRLPTSVTTLCQVSSFSYSSRST